jgi:singapore isolate B (sub-type 7) whole genome shotgun sequence assembly, scaffold_7
VDVHKINTVRLQGDLMIKKDKLETELRLLQEDLAKAHSRVYAELDSRREALEKELTEVNNRLEELAAEETERIQLLQERDVRIRNIAAKHQRLNQELMKNANKNRVGERMMVESQKENFMSRRPTMPSVSWSTGTVKKEIEEDVVQEPVKKFEEKKVNRVTVEDYHAFELKLDEPVKAKPEKVVPEGNRQRSGMSLAEYRKRYG